MHLTRFFVGLSLLGLLGGCAQYTSARALTRKAVSETCDTIWEAATTVCLYKKVRAPYGEN